MKKNAYCVKIPAIACILPFCLMTFLTNPALAEAPASLTEHIFNLEYQADGFNCHVFSDMWDEGKKFAKEPDFAERNIARGVLPTGAKEEQYTGFAWDQAEGKLYLDLNHNGDLTDDPKGIFEGDRPDSSYQTFEDIHLEVQRDTVRLPYVVRMYLYQFSRQQANCDIWVVSGFSTEIELYGRKWYVAVADDMNGVIHGDDQLFLLPLENDAEVGRNQHSLPLAERIFFDGHNYDLSFELKAGQIEPSLRVTFSESEVPMGRLSLEGKFIKRLSLRAGSAMVLLDAPGSIESIPAGEYECEDILLDGGELGLFSVTDAPAVSVAVIENETATLKVGGPLSSSVEVQRTGNVLQLSYNLTDVGGHSYTSSQRVDKPPTFTIYKGGKEIASGSFEYG
ncbi:MAG: hypothetical protein ACYS9Y_14180 [Planctomycetota bacterium]|jgi:hypothetical protein